MSALRPAAAILAYLGFAAIPVCVFTGVFGTLSFPALFGLVTAWMALLIAGMLAGAGTVS